MSEVSASPASVRRYVFFDEHRPSRAWMPTLGMINERFSQYLRSALLQHLQPGIEVTPLAAIKLRKHSEVIDHLASPSHLTLVNLQPLHGNILIAVDAELVGWIVESRFGGNGRFPATIPVRDFTAFEQNSMRRVVELILQQLAAAWRPIAELQPEIVRHESNPPFATFANSIDLVIVSNFDVKVGSGGGNFMIAIPNVLLEPLHEKLVSNIFRKSAEQDPGWSAALRAGIERTTTTLIVELAEIEITVREFLSLQPGHVFEIERPEAVTVSSGGFPLFRGRWGRHGRRIGVRIDDRLQPEVDALAANRLVRGS
jgi:flagellar motor switch protein FliM